MEWTETEDVLNIPWCRGQPPLTGIWPQISTVWRVVSPAQGGTPSRPRSSGRSRPATAPAPSRALASVQPWLPQHGHLVGTCLPHQAPGRALHTCVLSAQPILASSLAPPGLPLAPPTPLGLSPQASRQDRSPPYPSMAHKPCGVNLSPTPCSLREGEHSPALSLPLDLLGPVPAGVPALLPGPWIGRKRSINSEREVCVCLGAGSRKSNNASKPWGGGVFPGDKPAREPHQSGREPRGPDGETEAGAALAQRDPLRGLVTSKPCLLSWGQARRTPPQVHRAR